MFIKKNIPYNLRDNSRAQLSKPSRSKYDLNSISYKGSSLWNALPRDMKKCLDLSTFKNMLKSWNGPPCSCGFCVTCRFLSCIKFCALLDSQPRSEPQLIIDMNCPCFLMLSSYHPFIVYFHLPSSSLSVNSSPELMLSVGLPDLEIKHILSYRILSCLILS